jgi:hypothetical protein
VRKSKSEPTVESLSTRLESLDRVAGAIGTAIRMRGGKAKRSGHKTVEIALPSGRAKLRITTCPTPRMTPEERVLAEQFLERHRKTRRA